MAAMMKNKQIGLLFLSSFAVLFTGMGLFPLLPLYAAKFNAGASLIGVYFAMIYLANSLGPVAAGWLITRFSKRTVWIVGSAVGTPALMLLGVVQTFGQLVLLTAVLWFSGGLIMTLVSILTGLQTDASSRGKAFSLIGMSTPLGALVGGAVIGRLVGWQGYPPMFAALGVIWSIIPLIGWLWLKDAAPRAVQAGNTRPAGQETKAARLSTVFARLLAITFVGSMSVNISRLGSSLLMQSLDFSPEAVSSAAMISGLVAIPVTLAIGAYADRLGARHFLFIGYVLMLSGALILLNASLLWQFWLASSVLMLAYSIGGAMSLATTSEVVPASDLSKSLSLMNTLGAAASILVFAIGGVLFDVLGMPAVFLMAAGLALGAAIASETFIQARRAVAVPVDCPEG